MPQVLNIYHLKGRIPKNAVYCGRAHSRLRLPESPYKNPFHIGADGTRDEVCDRFEREILPTLNVEPLRGKDLVCFCAPQRCHCDSILAKANG
jgi:uncharacterized protein DUF4326